MKCAFIPPLAVLVLLGGCSSTSRALIQAHVKLPPPAQPLVPPRAPDCFAAWGKAAFATKGSFENTAPLDGANGEPLKAQIASLTAGGGAGTTFLHDYYAALEGDLSGVDLEAGWIHRSELATVLLYGGLGYHSISMDLVVKKKNTFLGVTTSTEDVPYSFNGFRATERLGLTATFRDQSKVRPFVAIAWQFNPKIAPDNVASDNADASRNINYVAIDLGAQIRLFQRGAVQVGLGSISATGGLPAQWWRGSLAFSWEWERPKPPPVENR